MKKILFLLFVSVLCWGKVIEERLNYKIEIADNASPIVQAAAGELQAYLARIYSAPIMLNGSKEAISFYVGANELTLGMPEGFAVICKGRSIKLYGNDDAETKPYAYIGENGSILAVFYFLRKYAGLKIYAPDQEKGEAIQPNAPLNVPAMDCPSFSFKVRGMGRYFPNDYNYDVIDRYAKKQLCSIPNWAQNDYYYQCINRWNKRFKDTPELFSLYDGERRNETYPRHLPCLSNPRVKEIMVSDIIAGIGKSKKKIHTLRMFCDAPFRRCECPNCKKVDTNENYFYGFILSVYDEVRKVYPDLHLFLQEKSPSHINPPTCRDRLDGIGVDISTGLPAVVNYAKVRPLYEAWAAKGARPMVRLYPRMPKWDSYPIINPHGQADCLKALQGVCWGQRSSDSASMYPRWKRRTPYMFSAMDNYVYVNTLLDVNADTDALVREFCSFMYPGAVDEMLEFYACMEGIYRKCNIHDDPLLSCYAYDKLAVPAKLLEKAAAKCTEPFWMSKMQAAFAEFMGYSKKALDENEKFLEFRQEADALREKFRKEYPMERVLDFGAKPVCLELCPVNLLKKKFQPSSVTVSVKDGNLLLELKALEEHADRIMRRAIPGHNGNVWADDSFEIMLAPIDGGLPYIQLIVNANGALQALRYDGKLRRSSRYAKAGELTVKGELLKDGWKGSIAFPLQLLEEFCPGKQGKIGIFRTNRLEPEPGKAADYPAISAFTDDVPQGNYHNRSLYRAFKVTAK